METRDYLDSTQGYRSAPVNRMDLTWFNECSFLERFEPSWRAYHVLVLIDAYDSLNRVPQPLWIEDGPLAQALPRLLEEVGVVAANVPPGFPTLRLIASYLQALGTDAQETPALTFEARTECEVSGEVLVQLAAIDVEEQVVKVLKRHFGVDIWMEEISRNLKVLVFQEIGATRFQQRWFYEDYAEIHDDAVSCLSWQSVSLHSRRSPPMATQHSC
ncbi:unnamed protein product [Durusdinium trenchii]|uniref:Uncharacterized protein n=1 Tax=Durusdinium trenchii TaxID=1381693 RepID=A0ABP0HHH1_9DINO